MNSKISGRCRLLKCPEIQELLEIRRNCDISERKGISKRIQREVRKQNGFYINDKAAAILKDFKELAKLQRLLELPKTKAGTLICDDDIFANFLQSIYESDSLQEFPQRRFIREIAPFTVKELTLAMRTLNNGKAADG